MVGLFVGLVTLDFIYSTPGLPAPNQKIVALDYAIAAGGPATNAAIAFRHLGNQATLLGGVGAHPISQLIRSDLQRWDVHLIDLDADRSEPPPTSSILVTQATGDRAVVSLNAVRSQVPVSRIPETILSDVEIILIDGHQMAIGQEIARRADVPIAIDGGSWKPGFEDILPYVTYAICSADFYPPQCHNRDQVFAYLSRYNIPHIAITSGEQPIQFLSNGVAGEVAVPVIRAIDTVGAGDFFHGAFCHFIRRHSFTEALSQAAAIAAQTCQSFGTRRWMEE